MTVTDLAAREGVTQSYVTRMTRLAFLSPAVIERVLATDMPTEFSLN